MKNLMNFALLSKTGQIFYFKDLRDDEDIVINQEWILNKLAENENEQYIWWLHPKAP